VLNRKVSTRHVIATNPPDDRSAVTNISAPGSEAQRGSRSHDTYLW